MNTPLVHSIKITINQTIRRARRHPATLMMTPAVVRATRQKANPNRNARKNGNAEARAPAIPERSTKKREPEKINTNRTIDITKTTNMTDTVRKRRTFTKRNTSRPGAARITTGKGTETGRRRRGAGSEPSGRRARGAATTTSTIGMSGLGIRDGRAVPATPAIVGEHQVTNIAGCIFI